MFAAARAAAQDPAPVPCTGQRISSISIRSAAPTAAAFKRVPILQTVVSALHRTTEADIIRRFLLLRPGDL
ncbi:MAG TPA: hypothetical protein VIP11_01950, partial [Gemmatimonadaceae bacterium]